MEIKHINRPLKNARAVKLVTNWLSVLKIPFTLTNEAGADISVTSVGSGDVAFQLRGEDSPAAGAHVLVVDAATITGRSLKGALAVFQAVVEALGYIYSTPVDRGEAPAKKPSFVEDPELVAFRHTEFRRSPNPDMEKMKRYEAIAMRSCSSFFRHHRDFCQDNMLDAGDLFTYAQVWTVNFLGNYELQNPNEGENEKLLTVYLGQRFVEFRTMMWNKGKNVFSHMDEVHIALKGTPFDAGSLYAGNRKHKSGETMSTKFVSEVLDNDVAGPWLSEHVDIEGVLDGEEEQIDVGYVTRHNRLDTSTSDRRRESAAKLLQDSLAALPHDEMVETLQTAIENDRIHPDARKEARSQLKAHGRTCSACALLAQEEEQMAGAE